MLTNLGTQIHGLHCSLWGDGMCVAAISRQHFETLGVTSGNSRLEATQLFSQMFSDDLVCLFPPFFFFKGLQIGKDVVYGSLWVVFKESGTSHYF